MVSVRQPNTSVVTIFSISDRGFGTSLMSGLGFRFATSNLHKEQNSTAPEGNLPRFFQKQTAAEGGCAFRAFNNVMGKAMITRAMIQATFEREKNLFQHCPINCPDPGKRQTLLSMNALQYMVCELGYSLKRIPAGRSPQQKFDWLLKQTEGRFLLVTFTDSAVRARDGHDLDARNHHHWIAVSIDENLVLDSLARTLGPQQLSNSTLTRSVRDGIIRIYEVGPARKSLEK